SEEFALLKRLCLVLLAGAALMLGLDGDALGAADPGAGQEAAHEVHLGTSGVSNKPEEFKKDLAIYSFAVFVLLLLILRKFAWGPIVQALDARERRIAEDIAAAARSHDEAKQL